MFCWPFGAQFWIFVFAFLGLWEAKFLPLWAFWSHILAFCAIWNQILAFCKQTKVDSQRSKNLVPKTRKANICLQKAQKAKIRLQTNKIWFPNAQKSQFGPQRHIKAKTRHQGTKSRNLAPNVKIPMAQKS